MNKEKICISLTKHAEKRLKERCGIPKKSMERMALKAFSQGISPDEAKGELAVEILKTCSSVSHPGSIVKAYGNYIYMFGPKNKGCENSREQTYFLITVLPLKTKITANNVIRKDDNDENKPDCISLLTDRFASGDIVWYCVKKKRLPAVVISACGAAILLALIGKHSKTPSCIAVKRKAGLYDEDDKVMYVNTENIFTAYITGPDIEFIQTGESVDPAELAIIKHEITERILNN